MESDEEGVTVTVTALRAVIDDDDGQSL